MDETLKVGDRVMVNGTEGPMWNGPGRIVEVRPRTELGHIYVVKLDHPVRPEFDLGGFTSHSLKRLENE